MKKGRKPEYTNSRDAQIRDISQFDLTLGMAIEQSIAKSFTTTALWFIMLSLTLRLYVILSMMLVRALSLTLKKFSGTVTSKSSPWVSSYNHRMTISSSYTARDSSKKSMTDLQSTQSAIIPRAAVSVVVRLGIPSDAQNNLDAVHVYYALVQRGKEPNKGIWSFPGGKVEAGESSLNAAKRELWEETKLTENATSPTNLWKLQFFEEGPVTSTDSIIHKTDSTVAFHYVITQWFAEIIIDSRNYPSDLTMDSSHLFPTLVASDDAADAKWFSTPDIIQGISSGQITKGVEKVIQRSELLYQKGLLDTRVPIS